MAQSAYGRIKLFDDFCGPEIPVANAVAYGTSAGGCNYYLGDFSVKGDLGETDTGVVSLSVPSGAVRLSGNNEDGKGAALCTEIVFSPALNGPIILEARVQLQALTTRSIFFGLCATAADDIAEPLTSVTVTHTLTAANLAGFVLDSQLTAAAVWHACYNGGSTAGATASTGTTTGISAVASEWDVLRMIAHKDGRVEFYINGALEADIAGAIAPTVLQAAILGCWGTTTTAADIDVDYLAVEASRDWTR